MASAIARKSLSVNSPPVGVAGCQAKVECNAEFIRDGALMHDDGFDGGKSEDELPPLIVGHE